MEFIFLIIWLLLLFIDENTQLQTAESILKDLSIGSEKKFKMVPKCEKYILELLLNRSSYLSPETLHCGQHLRGWQPQILGLTLQTSWEISDWLLKSYLTVRYLFLKSRDSLCWRQNRNTRMITPCPVFRSQFSSIWPECEKWGKRSKAGSCRIRYFCNTCRIRTQNILHRPLSPTPAFYFLLCLKLECLDIC